MKFRISAVALIEIAFYLFTIFTLTEIKLEFGQNMRVKWRDTAFNRTGKIKNFSILLGGRGPMKKGKPIKFKILKGPKLRSLV